MTIIPNQFFGLGDIIFTQTLVHRIADGRPIVWPVLAHFVEGLQRAYPHIKFVDHRTMQIDFDRRDQYEFEHPTLGRCTALPLRWADAILKVPYNDCMKAKYMLYGMDFEDWRERAMWVRDEKQEKELQYNYPYTPNECILVNNIFGSESKLTISIPIVRDNYTILMHPLKSFSIFDWAHMIEKCKEIHTVNTSIIYLLELLDLKAPEIHLYQRPIKGQTFDNISYLLKKHKYVFHG